MALLLLAVACGSPGDVPVEPGEASSTTAGSLAAVAEDEPANDVVGDHPLEQIGLNDLGEVRPGVARSVVVGSWGGGGDDDAKVALTRCFLRAPGEWVIEGSVSRAAPGPFEVVLGFDAGVNLDMVDAGVPVTVQVSESGDFAMLMNGFDLSRLRNPSDGSPVTRPFFTGPTCSFLPSGASVMMGDLIEVTRTAATEPHEWAAPLDSLQSLGSGVVMDDESDWRIPFAYLAWAQQPFPMPIVWVPDLPGMRLVSVEVADDSPCVIVRFDSSGSVRVNDPEFGIGVTHHRNCSFPSMLLPGNGAESEIPGFSYDETPLTRGLVGGFDGTLVSVESLTASIGELEAVAASLVPYRNIHAAPSVGTPGVDPDVDAALAAVIDEFGGTEHGRFPLGDLLIVPVTFVDVTYADPADPNSGDVLATSLIVRESDGYFTVERTGSEGGSDLCVAHVSHSMGGAGLAWVAKIGAEPDWTIQRRVDGDWEDLPTVGGVHFEGSTTGLVPAGLGPVRAVDGDRNPVRCSTWIDLSAGEQWSSWQPPTARNDLPLQVTPVAGLKPGDVVRVSGTGLPTIGTVALRMCRQETTNWTDSLDCEAASPETVWVPVGPSGLNAAFEVKAEFVTELGHEVDCRLEPCVVRADSSSGFRRAGWAAVEFAP